MTPEALAREAITLCASCDTCRYLLADTSCQFFPKLYALYDREAGGGATASSDELRDLIDLCNACGQCPCFNARAMIRHAKDAFVERDGLPWSARILEDVRLIGRVCGAFPRLTNLLNRTAPELVKSLVGIHPDRRLPEFPTDGFAGWARERGLDRMRPTEGRKVAYFTGCTARYLFPQVAKAAVEVLEHNGVSVHVPEQRCCGMPTMLEGDRTFTYELVGTNLTVLKDCIDAGYDIVTTCPTCGYMLKSLLRDGAQFSEDYRAMISDMVEEAGGDVVAVEKRLEADDLASTGNSTSRSAKSRQPWLLRQLAISPTRADVRDEGYFASLGGVDRIRVANHSYDLGEYLRQLDRAGQLDRHFAPMPGKLAFYPPCHQRELEIGQPWVDLLSLVPSLQLETVGDVFDCCGLGGIMGFKKSFHQVSLEMGANLAGKIRDCQPDRVVTDCLSCRLQFDQMLPFQVAHPVELLCQAYGLGAADRT